MRIRLLTLSCTALIGLGLSPSLAQAQDTHAGSMPMEQPMGPPPGGAPHGPPHDGHGMRGPRGPIAHYIEVIDTLQPALHPNAAQRSAWISITQAEQADVSNAHLRMQEQHEAMHAQFGHGPGPHQDHAPGAQGTGPTLTQRLDMEAAMTQSMQGNVQIAANDRTRMIQSLRSYYASLTPAQRTTVDTAINTRPPHGPHGERPPMGHPPEGADVPPPPPPAP